MYTEEQIRGLSRVNVNQPLKPLDLQSYWCRIVRTKEEAWNPKEHSHSFWELHLCLQGSCRIFMDDTEFVLLPRTLLFLPPHKAHRIAEESPDFIKFVWGVEFDDPELAEQLLRVYKDAGLLPAEDGLLSALDQVIESASDARFGAYDLLKQGLSRIFILLARRASGLNSGLVRKEGRKELELIRDYLYKNPGTSIRDISYLFHISQSTVERHCRTEYRMTFRELRQRLLTQRLRELLKDPELTMDQIAAMTGFSDRYAMGKFFKRCEGVPPGNYRKSMIRG